MGVWRPAVTHDSSAWVCGMLAVEVLKVRQGGCQLQEGWGAWHHGSSLIAWGHRWASSAGPASERVGGASQYPQISTRFCTLFNFFSTSTKAQKKKNTSQVWSLWKLNHTSAAVEAGRRRQMEPVFTPAVQLLSYSCNLRQRHGNPSHLLVPKQPWRT